jgi:hypothetical protein
MKHLKQKSLEELARAYRDEVSRLGYGFEAAIEALKRLQPADPLTGPENEPEHKEE